MLYFFFKFKDNGKLFEDVTLNLSWLTSTLNGQFVAYSLKIASAAGQEVWEFVETHPQYEYTQKKMQHNINIHTWIVKFIYFLVTISVMVGLFVFELEVCDVDSNDLECGLAYPSVSIKYSSCC